MGGKIAIVECAPLSVNPIDAHMRNSLVLASVLNADLITRPSEILRNDYEKIIISYASFYMDKALMAFIKQSDAELFWLTNEYNLAPNGDIHKELKRRNGTAITNFEGKVSCCHKTHMINLNTLLLNDRQSSNIGKYDCVYYGTFRPNRSVYFSKYMGKNVLLSTSRKNVKKFIDCCENKPRFIDKMDWKKGRETLRLFKKSLYIEDLITHTKYNHLANRFYEALNCNCMPVFDDTCIGTIRKSGYNIPKSWIISNSNMIKNIPYCSDQIKSLYLEAKKEKNNTIEAIKDIVCG